MKLQKIFIYSFPHLIIKNFIASKKIGNEDPILYCDLCKAVIAEARFFISKISPDKKVRVTTGNTRLTSDGQVKTNSKLIPKVRSEEFLEDLFEEKICDVMADDYIKWFEPKNDDDDENDQEDEKEMVGDMDFEEEYVENDNDLHSTESEDSGQDQNESMLPFNFRPPSMKQMDDLQHAVFVYPGS